MSPADVHGDDARDVQQVTLGSTTLYIPEAWMKRKAFAFLVDGGKRSISEPTETPIEADLVRIVFADESREYYPVIQGALPWIVILKRTDESRAIRWFEELKSSYGNRDRGVPPDQDGYWDWRTDTTALRYLQAYVLAGSEQYRPFGQPLVLPCDPAKAALKKTLLGRTCDVRFFWKPNIGVTYTFDMKKHPKSAWSDLDRRVLAFLDYLATPKP